MELRMVLVECSTYNSEGVLKFWFLNESKMAPTYRSNRMNMQSGSVYTESTRSMWSPWLLYIRCMLHTSTVYHANTSRKNEKNMLACFSSRQVEGASQCRKTKRTNGVFLASTYALSCSCVYTMYTGKWATIHSYTNSCSGSETKRLFRPFQSVNLILILPSFLQIKSSELTADLLQREKNKDKNIGQSR
jgi:hypothetical protein